MKIAADNSPLAIPPDLIAEIQATADEEHRSAGDVLRDAVNTYTRESRWQRMIAAAQARAKALGFTEGDVPRLIAEYREKQRQG